MKHVPAQMRSVAEKTGRHATTWQPPISGVRKRNIDQKSCERVDNGVRRVKTGGQQSFPYWGMGQGFKLIPIFSGLRAKDSVLSEEEKLARSLISPGDRKPCPKKEVLMKGRWGCSEREEVCHQKIDVGL